MKVLLLNIDSKLPNIALKKIEMWHELQGDEIIWDMPMMLGKTDKAYASCIFTKNRAVVENYKGLHPELIVGGTGYDLAVKLPREIDEMDPKINYGFTSRGCIRKCAFCLVHRAEGAIKVTGDIYDIWDGESETITLLDNNILALPEHFKLICRQLIYENLRVDFNQGLDIRLVSDHIADHLARLKFSKQLRFSFDSIGIEKQFRRGISRLKEASVRMSKIMAFVLVGFDSTPAEDLLRLEIIKECGVDAFIMVYQEGLARYPTYLREVARWVNQPHGFYKIMSFSDWTKIKGNEVEDDIV